MGHHETAVHDKFELIKHNISVPHTLEKEAELKAVKTRLLNIVNRKHGAELFDNDLLTLNELDDAKTLEDLRQIIDNYLDITDFYEKNYATFSWMIKENFFQDKLKGGDIHCWNEILQHGISYKRLNREQSTTFVMDMLTSMHHEPHPDHRNAALLIPESVKADHQEGQPDRLAEENKDEEEARRKQTAEEEARRKQTAEEEARRKQTAEEEAKRKQSAEEEAKHEYISSRMSQRQFEDKLIQCYRLISDTINDVHFWHQQVSGFCSGVNVTIQTERGKHKTKVPKYIKPLMDKLVKLGSIDTDTHEHEYIQSAQHLNSLIECADRNSSNQCWLGSKGKSDPMSGILRMLEPVVDNETGNDEKSAILDRVIQAIQEFHPKQMEFIPEMTIKK